MGNSSTKETIVIGKRVGDHIKVSYEGKYDNFITPHVYCDDDTIVGEIYEMGPEKIKAEGLGYVVVRHIKGLKNGKEGAYIILCYKKNKLDCEKFVKGLSGLPPLIV